MLTTNLRLSLAVTVLSFVFAFWAPSARAVESLAKEVVLMDAQTGAILFEKNADAPMAPASMSKLMTIYMVFERLQDGRLSLEDKFSLAETVLYQPSK